MYIYIYIYISWLYINLCCLLCRRSIMVSEAITWGQNTAQIINQTPGYSQYRAENAATMDALSDAADHETAAGWLPTYIAITFMIPVLTITETELLSFWQNFHQWLYRRLLKWQLPLQPLPVSGENFIKTTFPRAESRFAPSQWETALLCNDVSHWLGSNLESALFPFQWLGLQILWYLA